MRASWVHQGRRVRKLCESATAVSNESGCFLMSGDYMRQSFAPFLHHEGWSPNCSSKSSKMTFLALISNNLAPISNKTDTLKALSRGACMMFGEVQSIDFDVSTFRMPSEPKEQGLERHGSEEKGPRNAMKIRKRN